MYFKDVDNICKISNSPNLIIEDQILDFCFFAVNKKDWPRNIITANIKWPEKLIILQFTP